MEEVFILSKVSLRPYFTLKSLTVYHSISLVQALELVTGESPDLFQHELVDSDVA